MPMWSARRPIDRPSMPSTVASWAAARRMVSRLRAPSERCLRGVVWVSVAKSSFLLSDRLRIDKIARPFVLSPCDVETTRRTRNDHRDPGPRFGGDQAEAAEDVGERRLLGRGRAHRAGVGA